MSKPKAEMKSARAKTYYVEGRIVASPGLQPGSELLLDSSLLIEKPNSDQTSMGQNLANRTRRLSIKVVEVHIQPSSRDLAEKLFF